MLNEDLKSKLLYLKYRALLKNWDRYIEASGKPNASFLKLLVQIINDEYAAKKLYEKEGRISRAKIGEYYAIETFPFERQPKINKKRILAIYDSLDFMDKRQNIIWIGPTGSGKTGLATAFLIHALNSGYTGRFIMFHELIDVLYKSLADRSEQQVLKKFSAYDCLLVDEIGYAEIEQAHVKLFFTLMQKRHKKKTTLVTTNLAFPEWDSFLKNPGLTSALIDRLTDSSYVINMKHCITIRNPAEQL